MVRKYPAKVIEVEEKIAGVYQVTFESMKSSFRFRPGQFLHLALDEYDPSSQWPESRCFSMQSPPKSQYLTLTYAVKGAYTKRMSETLRPGVEVTLKLPYGDLFIKPHNKKNSIFLAGGTGITPFLSLFNNVSFADYETPALFVGFKTKAFNIYQKELDLAQKINNTLIIQPYFEDIQGIIKTEDVLQKAGSEVSFFISGPPKMISNYKTAFNELGFADEQIITDDWE